MALVESILLAEYALAEYALAYEGPDAKLSEEQKEYFKEISSYSKDEELNRVITESELNLQFLKVINREKMYELQRSDLEKKETIPLEELNEALKEYCELNVLDHKENETMSEIADKVRDYVETNWVIPPGELKYLLVLLALKFPGQIIRRAPNPTERVTETPISDSEQQKQYYKQIDQAINQCLFDTVDNTLNFIDGFEGFLVLTSFQKKNIVKNVLNILNYETNKAIGQPIWPAADVDFVSKSLTDALPNAIKTVNKALIIPLLNLPKNALAKQLARYDIGGDIGGDLGGDLGGGAGPPPGKVDTTTVAYNNLFTSSSSITDFSFLTGTNNNAFIISTCSAGGTGSTPLNNQTGSGGSGAYYYAIVYYSRIYNNVTYTITNLILTIANGNTTTEIIYKNSSNIGFKLSIKTFKATQGISGSTIGAGSTGIGGIFSAPEIVYNPGCPSIELSSFIFDNFGVNGNNGGTPNQNGSSNYTSSGSGVNTSGYSATTTTNEIYGNSTYTRYNYPNGLFGDPGKSSKMTLSGSKNSITSQGGGKTVVNSGYGSGGGAAPSNWNINGTNQASNIRKAGPAFIEIMSVIYMPVS